MQTQQVDYYLIPGAEQREQFLFACRLIDKAWQQDLGILVLCPDQETIEIFDELLWNWREDSFIPHAAAPAEAPVEAVLINSRLDIKPSRDNTLLLNLSHQVPDGFGHFSRIGEIVFEDEACKASSRDKFRYYREQGFTPRTHDLRSRRTG